MKESAPRPINPKVWDERGGLERDLKHRGNAGLGGFETTQPGKSADQFAGSRSMDPVLQEDVKTFFANRRAAEAQDLGRLSEPESDILIQKEGGGLESAIARLAQSNPAALKEYSTFIAAAQREKERGEKADQTFIGELTERANAILRSSMQ